MSFAAVILATGCGVISPLRGPGSAATGGSTGTGTIYVSNASANSVVRFSHATASSGNVVPDATISGSSTLLVTPQYLFVDSVNDRLYVANQGGGSILIFEHASTRTGNVTPDRSISGSSTTLVAPVDVQLDSTRDLLYVADGANVLAFASASTINGNIAPARTISVGFSMDAILVDSAGDRMFLADGTNNAIDIYDGASTLNHVVSPNRAISGSQTQLSGPAGLQIDNGGRLVVSNLTGKSVTIYTGAATANGSIAPVASISGSNTQLAGPTQLAAGSTSNTLFVADGIAGSVLIFSNLSVTNGNTTPNAISGSSTGLARSGGGTGPATAKGIALDGAR